ncbi:MAG TPA: extracellular solute-binding protein [Xanthobacteraceae bacterium]|nr:extracellular solute-binding protein [Xanthobacteraceae bacterium]
MTMQRYLAVGMAAFSLAAGSASQAFAQTAPALERASPQERARLAPVIEAAKQEGSVSYWDAVIQPHTKDALTAAFLKRYGLPATFRVNHTLAGTATVITRVEQEIKAGQVRIDVVGSAGTAWVYGLLRAGHILPYDSPELVHYPRMVEAGVAEPGYFGVNGSYLLVPMWSEEHLKFAGRSWKDVLGAVPNGRISVGDSSKSATYLATHIGLSSVLEADFFRKLAAMKPSFLVRSEQIAGRLVTGEDLMSFSGMPTRAFQYNQKGAKLKFLLPEEGVVLLAQAMFILKAAPHPNAAKLWVDFLLSEEGQRILAGSEALVSGRSGFASPLPDYAPNIDAMKVIKIDWKGMSDSELKKARDGWIAVFGN